MSAMKRQKVHVSEEENRLTISLMNGLGASLSTIPDDLIFDIFSRLPAKSIAMSRCVSKDWDALLNESHFTNLFLTRSCDRPRLLFSFQTEGKWSFYSSPQSVISDNNSSLVVVDNHMDVTRNIDSFGICVPVCGIICTKNEWVLSRRKDGRMLMCNPSTGKLISLPKVKSYRCQVITYIGYDPIGKQFKVLCMTVCERPFMFKAEEHQVLTLGSGKLTWRMIDCSVPHFPGDKEICINGVLYYLATDHASSKTMIVCFDVGSETFDFIINKSSKDIDFPSTLINYNGKLGGIRKNTLGFMDASSTGFELWVLDDPKEHTWSKHVYILPPIWKTLVEGTRVYIAGMIGTSEIVLSPFILSNPFYIYHLNMEKNTLRRVEIKGIGHPFQGQEIYTFANLVENVKPIM